MTAPPQPPPRPRIRIECGLCGQHTAYLSGGFVVCPCTAPAEHAAHLARRHNQRGDHYR
ncbi:hypothetical protein SAMN04489727_1697 [Amycolatopsis tolypomycina]|uniref:Uncharacterized protein n=1 Tax=Amycolatopsis tolypomycina TaxID=208445 RepID=A0A1H4JAI9_9PSEU|nr:hypothetical protein [Amycolatopsis tolypomycina]SEB43263.1 hypothetical protein SAMN04489727_1697 [Amycolatopsis tolypomycina]